ncbi:MAG: sodium:proton antiporter [Proteobacteria bacterium]|nr:sodium:proton antiporter [Pseudomonadota bacterium]
MDAATDAGWTSLLPALVTIGLAFATRQVIPALFAGIVTGSLVLYGQTGDSADLNFISRFFIPSIGAERYAQILLVYLWSLGGLLGIWQKTGAARHFAESVGMRLSRTRNHSLFFAWLLGVIFHQGGTISTVLVGSSVKPVSDAHGVSHEELAYVVDSTASPIATVLPFNAWPIYVGGLVAGSIPLIPSAEEGVRFFMGSLPYNFYAMFAVLSTLLFAWQRLPFVPGPMAAARKRALEGGPLDRPGAHPMLVDAAADDLQGDAGYPAGLVDFLLPLALLIGINVVPYLLWEENWVNEAFMASVLSAMLIARLRGMALRPIVQGFISGCASMTIGAIVLGLAVTIGAVAKELHTADFLVGAIQGGIPALALPAALMLLSMAIAFATGTSWGTYAVVFPIAMPLAWAFHPDARFVEICFGAVLGGSVFGDQCSPISDTTILSSMFTGCDLMDHVKTQLPLALSAAGLAALCSTLLVVVGR